MKRVIKLWGLGLFILIGFMFLPNNICAANTLKLPDENKTALAGAEVTFPVTVNFDSAYYEKINEISFEVLTDPAVESINILKTSVITNWSFSESNGVYKYTKGDKGANIYAADIIANLVVKLKSDMVAGSVVNVTLSNIKFYYDKEVLDDVTSSTSKEKTAIDVSAHSKAITLKADEPSSAKSKVAKLLSLTTSQGEMTPEFDETIKTYYINVKDTISKLTLSAECAENCSTINGSKGTKYSSIETLVKGENEPIEITVISEDQTKATTYEVIITRGIAEDALDLKSLEVKNYFINPDFDAKNLTYTLSVSNETEEIEIEYETVKDNAIVEITGDKKLQVGENTVLVKVSSTNGQDDQTYKIIVTRESDEESSQIVKPEDNENPDNQSKLKKILLIVGISVGGIGIITVAGILLFKKKKEDKFIEKELKDENPTITIKPDKLDENNLDFTREFPKIDETTEYHLDDFKK